MKKYLLKLTALIVLVGTVFSCTEDKVVYDEAKGPTSARFVTGSGIMGVSETRMTKEFKVSASTKSNVDRNITISFDEVASSENIGDFIEILPGAVIKAGEYEGTFTVSFKQPYPDETFEDLTAMLVLDAVDGANTNDNINKRLLLTIFRDCDYNSASVITTYIGDATANPLGGFPGTHPEPYPVKVTVNAAGEIIVDTLWGPEMLYSITGKTEDIGDLLLPGKITVNKADNTVKVVGTGQTASLVSDGTGTIDGCTNVITYTFTQGVFSLPFTVTVTLTPYNE